MYNSALEVMDMKFTAEKKQSIMMYLLEKIDQDETDVSRTVSEKCGISRNTVNEYIKELIDDGIIEKLQRNKYKLIYEVKNFIFERSKNELESDTYAYDNYFKPQIEKCTDEAKKIWEYSFSEMVNNVIDHSGAETLNVIVMQSYLNTTVLLVDDGIGIFEKIKGYFSFDTLEEARLELFKGKLTTDEKNHSGEGIFFTSKMMDNFIIYSSEMFFSTDKFENDIKLNLDIPNVNGTVVIMRLSNFTHRQIAEVFNKYSNVDGSFTKTRIPMKSIFDSSPVSRSQAKRICNRLEQFKEVILDFEGLEWMGQAFAHQLFVVYQNEHPDMILTPVNMNEEVKKMYNHVS